MRACRAGHASAGADRLWRLCDAEGRRLNTVVEMLGPESSIAGPEGERALLRYVGDFALFMSGPFRPWAERGGFLAWYLNEDARAHARAVALSDATTRPERLVHTELSTHFELHAGGLDYLRQVRFP